MHDVHTWSRFGVPPTTVRTVWMFGFQRRRVRRCECEIELPKPGLLPQISQVAATESPRAKAGDSNLAPGRAARTGYLAGTRLPKSAPTRAPPVDHGERVVRERF